MLIVFGQYSHIGLVQYLHSLISPAPDIDFCEITLIGTERHWQPKVICGAPHLEPLFSLYIYFPLFLCFRFQLTLAVIKKTAILITLKRKRLSSALSKSAATPGHNLTSPWSGVFRRNPGYTVPPGACALGFHRKTRTGVRARCPLVYPPGLKGCDPLCLHMPRFSSSGHVLVRPNSPGGRVLGMQVLHRS